MTGVSARVGGRSCRTPTATETSRTLDVVSYLSQGNSRGDCLADPGRSPQELDGAFLLARRVKVSVGGGTHRSPASSRARTKSPEPQAAYRTAQEFRQIRCLRRSRGQRLWVWAGWHRECIVRGMKLQRSSIPTLIAFAPLTLMLSGCEIIGNIFKAGVWVGVLAVFAVIALVVWGVKSLLS